MRTSIVLAVLLASTPVYADELVALEAKSVALGDFCGTVYFTHDEDGYRVVTTIAAGKDSVVRFVATLVENQRLTVSVPGMAGESDQSVEILRVSSKLVMRDQPASDAFVDTCPKALGE